MLGIHPGRRTYMSSDSKGGISGNSMLVTVLNRTGSDKKWPTYKMSDSDFGDKMTGDTQPHVFPDDFLSQLDRSAEETGDMDSQIVYTGSFRTEFGESVSNETDRLVNSFEVERLLSDLTETNQSTFSTNQTNTALPEDLASVSLMQTDIPYSQGSAVCNAGLSAPFPSLPNTSFDFPTTSSLDNAFSVLTTTEPSVLDLLTREQFRPLSVSAPLQRQDSLIESLPSNTSQLSDRFSPVEPASDSSSHSLSDHLNFTQSSSSKAQTTLNLPPPGRPGRKPGPNCNRTYKRRVVPKDTEEYLIKRAKNNIAIRKCREKAKKKQEETEEKMRELQMENRALREEVRDLRAEVSRLKGGST